MGKCGVPCPCGVAVHNDSRGEPSLTRLSENFEGVKRHVPRPPEAVFRH